MKISQAPRGGMANVLRILVIVISMVGLSSLWFGRPGSKNTGGTGTSAQQTTVPSPTPANAQQSEDSKLREQWQEDIRKVPLPKKGCFHASYPDKEWKEVPCGPPSKYPNQPAHGTRPNVVGNGNDVSAQVAGPITSAVGSFDSVSAGATVSGPWGGNPNSPDAFTLQLNSQFFSNATYFPGQVCNQFTLSKCAWQQFIYSRNQCGGPCVFMEYWLLDYGPVCPAGQPWIQSGTSCWFNSASMPAPAVTAAQLQGTTLTGNASAATDSVALTSPGGGANAMAADNVVSLSQSWNTVEWILCGDCCLTQANFSAATTIVPRTRVLSGSQNPPNCTPQGFTGETNNLSFGPNPPGASPPGPALIVTESIAGGAMSFCAAATAVGDTHLHTFSGLYYDFQAAGDFVLAQADRDFVVQTRQVSGAPTWPDADVNSAVATRMGNDKVAICLPGRLNVDGANNDLGDGNTFSTPDGVQILRKGSVYYISDKSGNSVRAALNGTYIDVTVGLGHMPANLTGLLANPNGNINQVAARDGTVFTRDFPFEDFYHRYGESWRVRPEESLLSVCGERVERGNAGRPFYAKDLEPSTYQRTRAVCTAAGVKEGPLLDACTLDVAVIGNDAAAKVFVGARDPSAVGIIITSGGIRALFGAWWWWLLLLLIVLLVIAVILWIVRKKKTTP